MIELLHLCGFDTLEYSWVKATIGICTLVEYSMAKKRQQIAYSKMGSYHVVITPCQGHDDI
jgi:hypothetical protein